MKDKQNKNKQQKNKKVSSCCTHTKKDKQCIRTKDKKVFDLPRKVDREICLSRDIKGFSMKSSCAPYKDCSRKQFLYNKDDPSRSFNVYIDKDPSDTIPIKYTTIDDVKNTIKKYLYAHVRSSFLRIDYDKAALSVYLPVAQFKKGSPY